MKNDKCKMRNRFRAFTLIEMAIILVILGLLIGATMPLLFEMTKHRHYRSTQKDIEEIGEALAGYAGIHWKLPPADTNGDGVGDANQTSGFFPYLDLGLGAVDSWRNRYYYDVNSRLLPTTTKTTLCTAISSIAAAEFPQLAFSSGGATSAQAFVVLSAGENSALNGGNTPFPGDRRYGSYAPTDTFDDLVIAMDPNTLYARLGCSGGGGVTPSCTSYTVVNRRGSNIRVRGGTYAACTVINNLATFTVGSADSVRIYHGNNCGAGNLQTTVTFATAQAADTDTDCQVAWNGTTLIDE